MPTDPDCLVCGHDRDRHLGQGPGPFDDLKTWRWCRIKGCSCPEFEPTRGGDAHGSAVVPRESRSGSSAGADVTGPATATNPADAVAGPPDPFIERLREEDRISLEREIGRRINDLVGRINDTGLAPAGPPADLCYCGHPLDAHPEPYRICATCQQEDRPAATTCWGWWPPGSRGVEVDEHGKETTTANLPTDEELTAGGRAFMAEWERDAGPIPEEVRAEVRRKWDAAGPPDLDQVTPVADERDHFQAAMHRMREAFAGVRQGRFTWEQGNDEFFDGYQQAKQAFGTMLLVRDVRASTPDLDHAIHAAAKTICGWLGLGQGVAGAPATIWAGTAARIAVEAAWPILRSKLRVTQAELKAVRAIELQERTLNREQDQALKAARAQLADLRDLLQQSIRLVSRDEYGNCQYCKQPAKDGRHGHCWHCGQRVPEHLSDCPVGAVLAATGRPVRAADTPEVPAQAPDPECGGETREAP